MLAALVLALGLAMDAVAAAAVRGLTAPRVRAVDVALIAALTGGFQGGMAALGWLAGARLGDAFERVDHWIAFAILTLLGGKAIVGALWEWKTDSGSETESVPVPGSEPESVPVPGSETEPEPVPVGAPEPVPVPGSRAAKRSQEAFALPGLIVLAFATSIDALAAGVTVPLLSVGAPLALAIIAGVTAGLVAIAVKVGRRLGAHLGDKLEVVGGIALIAIGAKILIEHVWA